MTVGPRHLKTLILVFWAAWSGLVFLSNLGDALVQLGILHAGFSFASGNYRAIVAVVAVHGVPASVGAVMFAGVLVWDAVNTTLFARASAGIGDPGWERRTDLSFFVALTLWCSLILADELFLSFKVAAFEATHRSILVALLASYLTIRLMPDARATNGDD